MKLIMERFNKFLVGEQDMKRVAKAVLIGEDGKVLILKRSGNVISKESPWEWDLPGGHIEGDETSEETLDREVWEETSLDLGKAKKIHTEEGTIFFVSREWEGKVMLSQEHEDYIWINPEDVGNYNIGKKYERAIETALGFAYVK
jgi:8-oxo-dGTP pyrophosphatase MutT (NUDIX family)